jgi:heat shock protein HspQ
LLLLITDEIGYGKWREIKQAIRRDARARFDHLFLSRSEIDLQKRVDILVKAIEKEDLDKHTPKPTFEEIAEQMHRALDELRIHDEKVLAELEHQKMLRR